MAMVTWRMDWKLSLIAFALSPPLFWLARASSRKVHDGWLEVKEMDSSAMSVLVARLVPWVLTGTSSSARLTETGSAVPVFATLWKAPSQIYYGGHCAGIPQGTSRYRWGTLPEFQCTGQERHGLIMY